MRVLWIINDTLPWTTCKVRDGQVLLLASVHGAQDAVETAFLGHVAVDHQLGGDKQVLLLVCVHGAQDAVETAFLGHSLSMHLKLAVSGLQPLGRHSNEFNFSRESIPMLSCAPVVLDRLLGSALVASSCAIPLPS